MRKHQIKKILVWVLEPPSDARMHMLYSILQTSHNWRETVGLSHVK